MQAHDSEIVDFCIRNDKQLGILVESMTTADNIYFFKHHDQPIFRHCDQMQRIVRQAEVKRTKKISVDIFEFRYEYFLRNIAMFRGKPLNSNNAQINKSCNFLLNKELGAEKRKITMAASKQKKIDEQRNRVLSKMKDADIYYHTERERRLRALFGGAGPQNGEAHQSDVRNVPRASVAPMISTIHEDDGDIDMEARNALSDTEF